MEHARFNLIDHNAKIFCEAKLAGWYAAEPLSAAEAITFIRQREAFAGKRVLDIGVGSGRTTRYILPFASAYLGIDCSPAMLARCRLDWPQADIMDLDIRNLAGLAPRQFDFIVASNAIFDVLTHEARLKALADCEALLAPKGLLYFSGHNRHHVKAGQPPALDFSGSPLRWPLNLARFLPDNLNHRRMRKHEHRETDYALLNDVAHGWRGVFYYTDRATQTRQIEAVQLALVEVLGDDGRVLTESEEDRADGLLHYVCRKRGMESSSFISNANVPAYS